MFGSFNVAFRGGIACALATVAIGAATPASATLTQSWNGYRWPRSGNLRITVGDNVSSAWDKYLRRATTAWSADKYIDFAVKPGVSSAGCSPAFGTVQACSANYGATGWLGYAQVWTVGSYIVQATVKLNDYYFTQPAYNNSAFRTLVACQELGHTIGLAHADTNNSNANLGTCMDYTNDPTGNKGTNGTKANLTPSKTDFAALDAIYATPGGNQLASTRIDYITGEGYSIDGEDADHLARAVPETEAWVMMVAGFGWIGGLLRAGRRRGAKHSVPTTARG